MGRCRPAGYGGAAAATALPPSVLPLPAASHPAGWGVAPQSASGGGRWDDADPQAAGVPAGVSSTDAATAAPTPAPVSPLPAEPLSSRPGTPAACRPPPSRLAASRGCGRLAGLADRRRPSGQGRGSRHRPAAAAPQVSGAARRRHAAEATQAVSQHQCAGLSDAHHGQPRRFRSCEDGPGQKACVAVGAASARRHHAAAARRRSRGAVYIEMLDT